jgi:hypothetical protein
LGLKKELLATGEIVVPNAEIANAEQIQYENKDGKLIVHIKANDLKYPLQRYNVLVNEVPVYGSTGISIAGLHTQTWERTDTITLSKGRNKIQVSVMNELGLENFKYPTYVNYNPDEKVVSTTYFVGIGVDQFQQDSYNLDFCVKDVTDLAEAFATGSGTTDTLLLTNGEVTRENLLNLKSRLMQTTVNDKVIISCSSHGLIADNKDFYLATHDMDFENPRLRGFSYQELESLLDGIPARQKMLLLDACNSGEIYDDKPASVPSNDDDNKPDDAQSLADNGSPRSKRYQMAGARQKRFIDLNEAFVNVRNNTGSVIISAAGGRQSAQEGRMVDGKKIENGAFTFSVLECLEQHKGKKLNVSALKQYAERRVEEITNGEQKPTSRQETMEVDWEVK